MGHPFPNHINRRIHKVHNRFGTHIPHPLFELCALLTAPEPLVQNDIDTFGCEVEREFSGQRTDPTIEFGVTLDSWIVPDQANEPGILGDPHSTSLRLKPSGKGGFTGTDEPANDMDGGRRSHVTDCTSKRQQTRVPAWYQKNHLPFRPILVHN